MVYTGSYSEKASYCNIRSEDKVGVSAIFEVKEKIGKDTRL